MPRAKKAKPTAETSEVATIPNPFDAPSTSDAMNTGAATPKRTANPKNADDTSLLAALKFIKFAQGDIGPAYMRHCVLYDGWAYAHDGVLSAGVKIGEHVQLAPHTDKLIAALERCEGAVALTQVGAGLQIRSGRLKAVIPCLELSTMPPIYADPAVAPLSDTFRASLKSTAPLAADGAGFTALAGILISQGTAVATNRNVLIQHYHGHEMPEILIPKMAAKELLRITKPLVSFGVSSNEAGFASITFYFDDESWFKTQLYSAVFPDYKSVLEVESKPKAVPAGFFEACRTLAPFVDDKRRVFLVNDGLATDPDSIGTTYEIAGLPARCAFNIDHLKMIESLTTSIDFGATLTPNRNNPLRFFGENVRGAIVPMMFRENDDGTRDCLDNAPVNDSPPDFEVPTQQQPPIPNPFAA